MDITVLQTISGVMVALSTGLLFMVVALPKVIDIGSIDRFKNFRDKILLKYAEILKGLDSKGDSLKYIREEVYPLTAYVSSLWNFIERWDKNQNFLTVMFALSSVFWILTLFVPLEFDIFNNKINFVSVFIWELASALLIFAVYLLYRFMKSRNKFINTINKIQLGEMTIDDFIEERKRIYKNVLKNKKLM